MNVDMKVDKKIDNLQLKVLTFSSFSRTNPLINLENGYKNANKKNNGKSPEIIL